MVDNFRTYLTELESEMAEYNDDFEEDGSFTAAELDQITYIYVDGKNISDLTGLKYFTELTSLYCGDNNLTALDVSKNKELTYLSCYGNKLTELNVSGKKYYSSWSKAKTATTKK